MSKRIFYRPTAHPPADGDTPWSSPAEFDETWKQRIAAMVRHIKVPGLVADFGCGPMWLKTILPPQNQYLGIDCLHRGPETIVCDFNRDPLPNIRAEVAFLSGVLEYIEDAPGFIAKLTALPFEQVILSYCTIEKHPDLQARRRLNWVSHQSVFDLLSYFLPRYRLEGIDDVKGNTILAFGCQAG